MTRLGSIEDALLQALAPLASASGGPFRQIDAFTQPDFEAAVQQLVRTNPPVCLLVPLGMTPTPLRANTAHDERFLFTLLIAARNLHGQEATRRGRAGTPGIYTLLDQVQARLKGYQIPAIDAEPVQPGAERLFAVKNETIVWRQDWSVTQYF